jgi:hypothetical protein
VRLKQAKNSGVCSCRKVEPLQKSRRLHRRRDFCSTFVSPL